MHAIFRMQTTITAPCWHYCALIPAHVISYVAILLLMQRIFHEGDSPIVYTTIQTYVVAPCIIAISMLNHGIRAITHFPPRQLLGYVILSSLLGTTALICIGFSVAKAGASFYLLFEMTAFAWNAVFGFAFLHEKLSALDLAMISCIICGLSVNIFSSDTFDWRAVVVQTVANLCHALGGVVTKKSLAILPPDFDMGQLLMWREVFSLLPQTAISLAMEWNTWTHINEKLDLTVVITLIITGLLQVVLRFVITRLSRIMNAVSLGVMSLFFQLVNLIGMHFMFKNEVWKWPQILGICMIAIGGLGFVIERAYFIKKSNDTPTLCQQLEIDDGDFDQTV